MPRKRKTIRQIITGARAFQRRAIWVFAGIALLNGSAFFASIHRHDEVSAVIGFCGFLVAFSGAGYARTNVVYWERDEAITSPALLDWQPQ